MFCPSLLVHLSHFLGKILQPRDKFALHLHWLCRARDWACPARRSSHWIKVKFESWAPERMGPFAVMYLFSHVSLPKHRISITLCTVIVVIIILCSYKWCQKTTVGGWEQVHFHAPSSEKHCWKQLPFVVTVCKDNSQSFLFLFKPEN